MKNNDINNLKNTLLKMKKTLLDAKEKQAAFLMAFYVAFNPGIYGDLSANSFANNVNNENQSSKDDTNTIDKVTTNTPLEIAFNDGQNYYISSYGQSTCIKNFEKLKHAKPYTLDECLELVLDQEMLTLEQLLDCARIVYAEAGTDYVGCYHVMSTAYNRKISYKWTRYVNKKSGENKGYNIYGQLVCKGQFAYGGGNYKKYCNYSDEEIMEFPGWQAIIDCLLEGPSHNFLSFKDDTYSKLDQIDYKVQLEKNGDYFHEPMEKSDIIPVEKRCTYPYDKTYERTRKK